jgi:3-phenylpropionate/cinnamic acid dioxygenase small subunit
MKSRGGIVSDLTAPDVPDVTDADVRRCADFLFHEAELLDDNRVDAWLALLADDLVYQVPVRCTRERAQGPGFSHAAFHMNDTRSSMAARVERLAGEYAWAEDPPSRTRRFVSNVRVRPGEEPGELAVRSNLLLYRSRHDDTGHQLIVGERHDLLRRRAEEPGLTLARRLVLLDHTSLPPHNLAVFL